MYHKFIHIHHFCLFDIIVNFLVYVDNERNNKRYEFNSKGLWGAQSLKKNYLRHHSHINVNIKVKLKMDG